MDILKLIKQAERVIKLLQFPIQITIITLIILPSIPSLSLLHYDQKIKCKKLFFVSDNKTFAQMFLVRAEVSLTEVQQ